MQPFKTFLFVSIFFLTSSLKAITPDQINRIKNGIVSISVNVNRSAYGDMGRRTGTGFLIDRENGIIVTNRHVTASEGSGQYELTFFNGREVEGKFYYADPWHDFAFLKIDPALIPKESKALSFEASVSLDEEIFIIGKNAGKDFSFQTGRISSLYEDMGALPNQSMRISLNNRGGSSGSPVCNLEGKVVGLIHSSDMDSFGFALPIDFIKDALIELSKKGIPSRQHCGALLTFYSLDHAVKFLNFPDSKIESYLQKYPHAVSKCLLVKEVFEDSPARDLLLPGDIIWSINGQEIGPNFYLFEHLLNTASRSVKLGFYRRGEYLEQEVPLYNLQDQKIQKFVTFGGAIFYEINDTLRRIFGAKSKSVFVTNILPGSSLYQAFPYLNGIEKVFVHVKNLDGHPIKSLEDLIALIPSLSQKKYFTLTFQNYAFQTGYDNLPFFSRRDQLLDVTYELMNGRPEVMEYNPTTLTWEIKGLQIKPPAKQP